MPPKKFSKKIAPAARPIQHMRLTRSQTASQALSQIHNIQQSPSDPPPPPPPEAIVQPRQQSKLGQKRSIIYLDEPTESSGSNKARKKSKVNPASSNILAKKPRGRPRKVPLASQLSPPSQNFSRIPTDKKGKGKAKQALLHSSKVFNPPTNSSSDLQANVVPDLSSDEYPPGLNRDPRSNQHGSLGSEDVFRAVRMNITLLQPEEARQEMRTILNTSDSQLDQLNEEILSLNACISDIENSIKTIKAAQIELAWITVVEVIEDIETMLSTGTYLRSPTTNTTTDLEVKLPAEWRLWKSEALVCLGEVQSAKDIFPRQAESIDKYYRYRVKGLIEFAEQSYQEALVSLDKAAERLGLSYSREMDRRDGDVIPLMERARELQRSQAQILAALRRRSEREKASEAQELIKKTMLEFRTPKEFPLRLSELPIRLSLREILCDLATLHETWDDDGLSDLREYIRQQECDLGFRFDQRNNLPVAHRSYVWALYFYHARAELYGDDYVLSDHHFDILNRLDREGWRPLRIMGADRADPEINDQDVASRLPTPELQDSSFDSQGPPPAQKRTIFVDYKHYYDTLEISSRANAQEIKKAYKEQSKLADPNAKPKIPSDENSMMPRVGITSREADLGGNL
ncbi:hypothetical protein DFH28DRAFT_881510 [Melampsora americana]|nr:hypothetical protein DFH28DRAFT_881510 [Melampsora americana]